MFALDMLAQVDVRDHEKTQLADEDWTYNCIGWAVGVIRWVWHDYFYDDIESFVSYWTEDHGFRVVGPDEKFDPTKIYNVLMARHGEATHAIRYDPERGWTSKEGADPLYNGNCPQALYANYGRPVAIVVKG